MNVCLTLHCYLAGSNVHCVSKKLHPFYFCNNFFFIPEPIFIIFGKNVAKDTVNMQSLNYVLAIDSSNVIVLLRTSLSVSGVAENTWCPPLKITL